MNKKIENVYKIAGQVDFPCVGGCHYICIICGQDRDYDLKVETVHKGKHIKRNKKTMPSDNVDKCGIKGIITWTPEEFKVACRLHDLQYVQNETGEQTKTRKEVDRELLVRLLALSGNSLRLKAGAYLYYGISRAFGGLFW